MEMLRHYEVNQETASVTDFKVRITPYLDHHTPCGYTDLGQFVQATAEQASKPAISSKDMRDYIRYLELLAHCWGSASSGTLLVSMSAGGQLAYVAVDDFREFILSRERVLERALRLRIEHELVRQRQQVLQRELQRQQLKQEWSMQRGYGLGRSL